MSIAGDCEDIFAMAQRFLPAAKLAPWIGPRFYLFHRCIGALPVRRTWPGSEFWELVPRHLARRQQCCLIIAVRTGAPYGSESCFPWIEACRNPVDGLLSEAGIRRKEAAAHLFGEEIIDLLACDLTLQKPPLRLTGLACALGRGSLGYGTLSGEDPVHLVRTPMEWIARALEAPCLPLGTAEEQHALIRSFEGGIVAADLAQGMALEKALKRPGWVPPIQVLQEPGAAAA